MKTLISYNNAAASIAASLIIMVKAMNIIQYNNKIITIDYIYLQLSPQLWASSFNFKYLNIRGQIKAANDVKIK